MLCECGCGQPTSVARRNQRGIRKGEHVRFVSGHNRRGHRREQRWRAEDRGYRTPCWIWLGYVEPGRYAKAARTDRRGMCGAHRLVYEEEVGPIPAGHDLDHRCRQKDCVNPAHLEPVTRKENLRRGAGNGGVLR